MLKSTYLYQSFLIHFILFFNLFTFVTIRMRFSTELVRVRVVRVRVRVIVWVRM